GWSAVRSARVSTVYVAPPRSRSTVLTEKPASPSTARRVMASRCSGEATGAGLSGCAWAGTNTTSSRPGAGRTSSTAARWPRGMGAYVPPKTPRRRSVGTSVPRADAPEGVGHEEQADEAREGQGAVGEGRDRKLAVGFLGSG